MCSILYLLCYHITYFLLSIVSGQLVRFVVNRPFAHGVFLDPTVMYATIASVPVNIMLHAISQSATELQEHKMIEFKMADMLDC